MGVACWEQTALDQTQDILELSEGMCEPLHLLVHLGSELHCFAWRSTLPARGPVVHLQLPQGMQWPAACCSIRRLLAVMGWTRLAWQHIVQSEARISTEAGLAVYEALVFRSVTHSCPMPMQASVLPM